MYAKNIVALTAFAALADQAVAFNSHRHLHRRNVDKRQDVVVTDWVTVWETVAAGQASEPTPTAVVAEAPPAYTPPTTTLVTAVQPAHQVSVPAVAVSVPSAVSAPPAAQSSAAASTTAASSTPSPSTGGLSGKRGIAYNDQSLADAFSSSCKGKCGWAYNWGSSSGGFNGDVPYIPMLWGPKDEFLNTWDQDATKAIAGGCKAIFSFNEPDNAGQANLTPQDAAAAHIKYVNKYAGQTLIGAPSITNSGNAGEGIQWLNSFMSACNGECKVDFCNVHWYSEAQYADTLFTHLDAAHKACGGKPIWLTEFAPIGDQSQTPDFLRNVIPKLESLDYLHAYSYFMVANGDGKLMGNGQSLSEIGQVYASL